MIDQRQALEYYNYVKSQGAEATRRLAAFAEERHAMVAQEGVLLPRADVLRRLADALEHKPFTIAVVGEFSRGKSTLLNALLGRADLLPTSILPTTTAITVLTHSEDEYADVKFNDGQVEEHRPLANLARYVADGNLDARAALTHATSRLRLPRSEREVADMKFDEIGRDVASHLEASRALPQVGEVDVFCNSPFLRTGIRLVDTPGLGSVNPEHGQRTREYIHNADAVIFLINTDPVISAAECNFLAFLQEYVSHFIFVVTKIDRFSEKERAESLGYTTQIIRRYTQIEEPCIYPLSSRLYLEGTAAGNHAQIRASGFPDFVEGLDHYLICERGKVVLHNLVRTVKPHFDDLQRAVGLELKSLDLDEIELQRRLGETRKALDDARYVEQSINERTAREFAAMAELLQSDSDWPRFVSVVMKDEVAAEIAKYHWRELQQASTLLPTFVKDRIQDFLQGPMQRVTRHLVAFSREMMEWVTETLDRMRQQIPFDLKAHTQEMEWDIVFEFDADSYLSALKRVGTITVGSTLAFTLANLFLFEGIAAVIMIGGLLASAGVANALRERTRKEVEDAAFRALDELGQRLPSVLKQEALNYLDQFRTEAVHALDNAISGVAESVRQLEASLAGGKFEAADRRRVLERQLAELGPISTKLFETQFWAGYVRAQEEGSPPVTLRT